MPKPSRRAFVIGRDVFYPVPPWRGLYIRVGTSVLTASCGQCGATPGVLCRNRHGDPHAGTHYVRRAAAKKIPPPPDGPFDLATGKNV